jgi:Protein of unknown function (DUF1329)
MTCDAGWRRIVICVLLAFLPDQARGMVQPGETITTGTMARAEELLTPATRWMVERGMPMPVIAPKAVAWPTAYKEATAKYGPQVTLSADGTELRDYVAGAPFPIIDPNDPLAGFRAMWNLIHGPYTLDNMGTELFGELINSKGAVERTYETTWGRLSWTGRLSLDPTPQVPNTPPIRYTNLFGPYRLPHDLSGLTVLDIHYLSPERADEAYAYFPETRKVRRLSVSDRGGPLAGVMGTDYDIDSFLGFNGNLHHWNFRMLAEKDILAVVHSGKYGDRSAWCAPRDGTHGILAALPCVSWEKRPVWIVEGTPRNFSSEYAYSKRVLYIDREFFFPLLSEIHDQRGELWKGLLHCMFYTKAPYEGYPAKPQEGARYHYQEEMPFMPNWVLIDFQQVHATAIDAPSGYTNPTAWRTEWYFNENVATNTPALHSLNALQQKGR